MPRSRRLKGRVRAIGRGGDAVVETSQGIVMVPGALPGERIELEQTSVRRGAARGSLVSVLEPDPNRREPPCPDAERCGGCPLMIATPELQRRIKLGFLAEACRGLPGGDIEHEWVPSPAALSYRRRARFAWRQSKLGYRQRQSNQVVDIGGCVVLAEPLQRAWRAVRESLQGRLRGQGEIQLLQTGRHQAVVDLLAQDEQDPALFEACEALSHRESIAGVALRTGDGEHPASWGATKVTIETADGGALSGPVGSFMQANDGVNSELISTVIALAEPAQMRVLELHCGIGNFTLGLAASAKRLVAIEQDQRAVQACRENLQALDLRARVVVGDANEPPRGRYDVVVLDPPRQGAKAFFEGSVLPAPKRIIYVSCDTSTLARDLRLATERGYRIDRAIAFDMFPQTAHLETVVRLVRQ